MKLKRIGVLMTMVLILGTGNVFAATKAVPKAEEPEKLTIEIATEAAVASSDEIAKIKASIVNYEETDSKLRYSLVHRNLAYSRVLTTQDEMAQNSASLAQAKQDLIIQPEAIALSVVKSFVSILDAKAALAQYDKSFDLQKKQFDITTLRKELGMLSDSEFETEKTTLEKTRDSRKTYVDNIDNAYRDLNRLMGIDPETKHVLDFDVEYEKLGKVDLASHISSCISIDKALKSYDVSISIIEGQIETYISRIVNEATYEISADAASVESYQRKLSQNKRDIESRTKAIEDTIRLAHANIINMESDYDKKMLELSNMYKQLEVKKVQLELGQITELELQNFQINSIDKTENEIRSLIYNHYAQIMKFNNINLVAQ